MRPPTATSRRHGLFAPELPAGCSGIILAVVSACFVVGLGALAAWGLTGNPAWIREFFQIPAALLMVWLAAVELWLSSAARLQFAPGELMRRVWSLIAISAGADLVGTVAVQILGIESRLNVLTRLPGWSKGLAADISVVGHLFGGPLRGALLAAGLWYAVAAYHRARFLGKLRAADWLLLALGAVFIGRNVADVVLAVRAGKVVGWVEAANWPTDPLLWMMLGVALRLYRSVQQMGGGWIGRCWRAFSIGVFLTALGNVGLWAEIYGYLRYPWTAAVWFVWLPAAACFALAPAYQLEAIANARAGRLTPQATR